MTQTKSPNPSGNPRLALVEDSAPLRANTIVSLEAAGFVVQGFGQVEDYYRASAVKPFDIVLMDLGLPGEDGLSAIRHLSDSDDLGIIVITARGALADREAAIAAGADHYLVKPIRHMELVSAIDALWRRMGKSKLPQEGQDWLLDPVQDTLTDPHGRCIHLTHSESILMQVLAESPRMAVERETLLQTLFPGQRDANLHRIEVLVSRLRQKFKAHGVVLPLRSIFGKGLCFNADIQQTKP
jgi:two-component system, OmpR family, response regulator PhoP